MDFFKITEYLDSLSITGDILEIGSERGNNSTEILAEIAHQHGVTLYSVDIDPDLIRKNTEHFRKNYPHLPIKFVNSTGEEFLRNNRHLAISMALLDNFDWTWFPNKNESYAIDQSRDYLSKYGLVMNNLNSQATHISQAISLMPLLTNNCMIICDDTFRVYPQETYSGKCGAVVPYLLSQRFDIVYQEANGLLMVRK